MEGQKNIIQISDQKIIKVFKKPFTKKILDCFDEKPKTAGEIANSISFPKEKIYYHIKKLISSNLLYVTSTEMVKGIEQKLFSQQPKNFQLMILKLVIIKRTLIGKDYKRIMTIAVLQRKLFRIQKVE